MYVGEMLQLNCTLNDSISWDSQDLVIKLDNEFCVWDLAFSMTFYCSNIFTVIPFPTLQLAGVHRT